MKKILLALLILFLPLTASAQFTTTQGGTGVKGVAQGSILFGSSAPTIRMATSSVFQWNDTLHRLSFTYGSTTAISATTICLVGDTCRTTWPSGTGTVTSVATNNGLTGGTITTTGTIGLAAINAGVLGASTNSTVPTSQATSTLYGAASTGGFVLQWSNATGGLVLAATSSSASSGAPFPFTPGLYNTQAIVATSTGVWFTGSPLSIIASSTFFTYASSTFSTFNFASTTMVTATTASTTNLIVSGVRSALHLASVDGTVSAYGGASACASNNFVTALSAIGGTTCGTASVTVTAGTGLAGGGAVALGATITLSNPFSIATTSNDAQGGLAFYSKVSGMTTLDNAATSTNGTVSTIAAFDSAGRISPVYASTTVLSTTGALFTGSYHGVASSTPWAFLAVNPTAGVAANELVVGSSTATAFLISNAGNTGIGSSTPYFRLTLDRTLGVASSSIFVKEYTPTATSTAMTADCHDSNTVHLAIGTSATTITLALMQPGEKCVIIVSNPNGVAGAITWASATGQHIYWAGGTTPTQTTTANARDVWSFVADEWLTAATTTPGISVIGAASLNAL